MDETVIRYAKRKAIASGLIMLAAGTVIVWLATELLDATWTSPGDDGSALQGPPIWLRVPFLIVVAGVVLMPGAAMLRAGLGERVIVRAGAAGISARTLLGSTRRLSWGDIVVAKRKQSQIVLSPTDDDFVGHEIWDRRSVLLDVGLLEVAPADVEALILRYRPDLAIVSEPE